MPNLDYKAFLNNTEPLTNTDYLKLSEILRFHEHQYYVLDNPLISDYEYDLLYKILESTENHHPDWIMTILQRKGFLLISNQVLIRWRT
ncbi:MAG: hypothetical protein IPH93_14690 [Saprospiraceae bacterium]|nr:hypothetical protein [Saprospiraceae bacterium]